MIDQRVLRAQLEEDLQALLARHERLSAQLRNEDREVPADWTERAQFTENDEVLEALEVRTLDHIRQVQRTMRLIDEGRYGVCTGCGARISEERLDLLPSTSTCTACIVTGV